MGHNLTKLETQVALWMVFFHSMRLYKVRIHLCCKFMLQQRRQISIRSKLKNPKIFFWSFVKLTWFHNICTFFKLSQSHRQRAAAHMFLSLLCVCPQVFGLKLFQIVSAQLTSAHLSLVYLTFFHSSFPLAHHLSTPTNLNLFTPADRPTPTTIFKWWKYMRIWNLFGLQTWKWLKIRRVWLYKARHRLLCFYKFSHQAQKHPLQS